METTANKLWNKNFILYVIAYELADTGSSLLKFAIPIYIFISTGNLELFGTILALTWLPFALFSLPGGLLADRFNKRNIMVLCNVLIAVAIIMYAIFIGNIDTLIISVIMLVFMTGIESVQSGSSESVVFTIVPTDKIMQANSTTFILRIGSGLLAPIIAGFMLSQLGLNAVIFTSLICFFTAILLYGFMRVPFIKPEKSKGLFSAAVTDIKSSFNYIRSEKKILKRATIGLFIYSTLYFPAATIIPSTLINNILEMNEASIGISQGIIATGGILSVIIINKFGSKINTTKLTHLLVASATVQLLTMGLFVVVSSHLLAFVILTFGLLLNCAILILYSLNYFTYLGQNTPEAVIGKIVSVAMTVMMLGGAVSQFTVGRLLHLFSNNLVIAALVIPVVSIIASLATVIKEESSNSEFQYLVGGSSHDA